MIKSKHFTSLIVCIIMFLLTIGCSSSNSSSTTAFSSNDSIESNSSIESHSLSEPIASTSVVTSYTIDELLEKGLKNNSRLDKLKDIDRTKEAISAYNIMLSYVENSLNLDYKIYSMYYVEMTGSYVLKIVLDEDIESFEAEEKIDTTDIRPQSLIYDNNGDITSTIIAYKMGKKWKSDVINMMKEKFPQYGTTMCFVQLCRSDTHPIEDVGYKDIHDYNYYYNFNEYDVSEKVSYDNVVNIIAPVGTDEKEAEKIFEEVKPELYNFCVTKVNVMSPSTEESYNTMISEKDETGYYFSNNVDWHKSFTIKEGLS